MRLFRAGEEGGLELERRRMVCKDGDEGVSELEMRVVYSWR